MGYESALGRILNNPFYVLGLRPDATRAEIERQGTKLIHMLELKLKSARSYSTPVGSGERTPEKVRQAMAELREPSQRLYHELWAKLPAAEPPLHEAEEDLPVAEASPRADAPWPEALEALGWRAR